MKTMKKTIKSVLAVSAACLCTIALSAASLSALASEEIGAGVADVVVNTYISPYGQCFDTIDVTVTDASLLENVTADAFSLAGEAGQWGTDELHDFTATVSEVSVDGDVLTLTITDFGEKYFYVDNFTVTCEDNPDLSFNSADKVSNVTTAVADDFEMITTSSGLSYNLYTPENTDEALPIVISFHGAGDTNNLEQNQVVVAWALPENQEERPCYVLGPIADSDVYSSMKEGGELAQEFMDEVHDVVQEMIDEGKVDPNRVYITGKSAGGSTVWQFLAKYPDFVAAALPMCGGNASVILDNPDAIEAMVDIPIYIAHAINDDSVDFDSTSRVIYKALVEAGSKVVKIKAFIDEEMNAAGVDGVKIGYHTVEMATLTDESFMVWMFNQVKGEN